MAILDKFDLTKLDEERQKFATGEFRKGFKVFKGYTMPESFELIQQEIEDFEVYDDDIWITTFPKCGTTWTQEMVWCIHHNLDYAKCEEDIDIRMPFIEYSCILCPKNSNLKIHDPGYLYNAVDLARDAERPRLLKTHLPFELLPKQIQTFQRNPTIIHVYRNIKDTCVSYYHHNRLFEGYRGDFDLFWKLFISGKRKPMGFDIYLLVYATPMLDNILSYLQHRNRPNFLFVRFEDMKHNLRNVVIQVCDFFKKSFSDKQIDELVKHLSFDAMKNNKFVNKQSLIKYCIKVGICVNPDGKFIRSGKSGGYKSEMSQDVEQIFEEYLKEKLKGTDLVFG